MASRRRQETAIPAYAHSARRPFRQHPAQGAGILWWWLWIAVAALALWWVLWGWGDSGGWVGRYEYHTGTNGGRISEKLGQPTDQPEGENHQAEGVNPQAEGANSESMDAVSNPNTEADVPSADQQEADRDPELDEPATNNDAQSDR
jgi:hypothetical protein